MQRHSPFWLRQREGQGRNIRGDASKGSNHRFTKHFGSSCEYVARLQLSAVLGGPKGHTGCVNTIAWNSTGDKIVSGSDDMHVKIWDTNSCQLIHSYHTGHSANIFSAKFMPFTNDLQIISCAGDCEVRWTDLTANCTTVYSCNRDRVKKLCSLPRDPSVFLSCSEDGSVRRYDLRERHICGSGRQCKRSIIIDLSRGDQCSEKRSLVSINSLSMNEIDGHCMALGGSDPVMRLYDIRRLPGQKNCIKAYRPSHLVGQPGRSVHITGVAYSFDGRHILANYNGDHAYLFDPNETILNGMELPTTTYTTGNLSDTRKDKGKDKEPFEGLGQEEEEEEDGNQSSLSEKDNNLNSEDENDSDMSEDDEDDDSSLELFSSDDYSADNHGEEDEMDVDQQEMPQGKKRKNIETEKQRKSKKGASASQLSGLESSQWTQRYVGHVNVQTVKEIDFFGPNSEFVASGSDDGRVFIWEKLSGKLIHILHNADSDVVNCVKGHPLGHPIVATSGIEENIKLWNPTANSAKALEGADEILERNQKLLKEGSSSFRLSRRMMLNILHLMSERESDSEEESGVRCVQS